jgi:hypothetical protein
MTEPDTQPSPPRHDAAELDRMRTHRVQLLAGGTGKLLEVTDA